MKRLAIALSLAMLMGSAAAHAAGDQLPLRARAEEMGARVEWDGAEGMVTLEYQGAAVRLMTTTGEIGIDGAWESLGAPLAIENGRTQIPAAVWAKVKESLQKADGKVTGFTPVAQFAMPDKTAAEIVAATPDGRRLLVTNAGSGTVTILNIWNIKNITVEKVINLKPLHEKAETTSVAVSPDGKFALATIRTGDDLNNANRGLVVVIDLKAQEVAGTLEVGIGPDSVTISRDGKYAVVANEDEEGVDGEVDMKQPKRPGSVSILELPEGNPAAAKVTTLPIDLTGVPGAVYAHDPQPEYVAISPDSKLAAVTLQENNAVAIVDLAGKKVQKITGLGTVSHKADLKKDKTVSFTDDMTGRPEPDAVAFTADGKQIIIASEGDLGKNEFGDGVKAGGRNIMILDLEGKVVYDSQNIIDEAAAAAGIYPDTRSENKGSEPEFVATTRYGNQELIVAAAERANALFFFDATDLSNVTYIGLAKTGVGPESAVRVPRSQLLVSADEVSGTLTFFLPTR